MYEVIAIDIDFLFSLRYSLVFYVTVLSFFLILS